MKKQRFGRSVLVAWFGMITFFRKERNGRIQLIVAMIAVVLATVLRISLIEWVFILFCICLVLITEMINSAIEKVCDLISEAWHPGIRVIKDISAGAVLLACFFSIFTGAIIFTKNILAWIG